MPGHARAGRGLLTGTVVVLPPLLIVLAPAAYTCLRPAPTLEAAFATRPGGGQLEGWIDETESVRSLRFETAPRGATTAVRIEFARSARAA